VGDALCLQKSVTRAEPAASTPQMPLITVLLAQYQSASDHSTDRRSSLLSDGRRGLPQTTY
jgi:hypothetical protein